MTEFLWLLTGFAAGAAIASAIWVRRCARLEHLIDVQAKCIYDKIEDTDPADWWKRT